MKRLASLRARMTLFYPVFCFTALWFDKQSWVLAYLFGVCALYIWQSLLSRSWKPFSICWVVIVMLSVATILDFGHIVLWFPPLLITLVLFFLFSSSLRSGEAPFVTRIALLFESELSVEKQAYTRRVTLSWSVFLLFMIAELAALSLWASPELWSLMTNIVNYLLIFLFLLIEFVYRRWRFRDSYGQPTFVDFLCNLRNIQSLMQTSRAGK